MNKKTQYLLITTLIIAHIATFLRIGDLQGQIQNARAEISYLRENTASEVNAIYSNVDEMLKREASLIENAGTEIGAPDLSTLTVPIKFSLTPKETVESTAVSLDFDGEVFPMERTGTTFSATVSRYVFGSAAPMILIDENGVKKTTRDGRLNIGSIKTSILPELHPRLIGESRYSNGTYTWKGTLSADFKGSLSGITFTEMRFVIKVDDAVFSDEIIAVEASADWSVEKVIPLANGQICVMTVIAIDSLGLQHHCIVSHWVGGANAQREPLFNDERIYSADGKLLWEPEYKRVDGEISLRQ